MARLIKPKQEMPAFDTSTPEGAFKQGIAIKKRDFQKHYDLERSTIIRRGRAKRLSNEQINKHLDQLNTNADRKALELGQEEELGLIKVSKPSITEQRLQAVTGLEQSGRMSLEQATEARTRMEIGPTAASVLYREPDKPDDPMAEFGKLDVYRNRLESRIKDFRMRPSAKKKQWWKPSRYEETSVTQLEVYDPTLVGKDKKGEYTGDWRKATLDEIKEYGLLTQAQERATTAQRPLISGMMRSHLADPRGGGAIDRQVSAYLENKTTPEPQQRGQYTMGQVINQGGKSYKIVGFDTDGVPLVEEAR